MKTFPLDGFLHYPCITLLRAGDEPALFIYREGSMKNARYHNGSLRRKHRARFKAMGAPCGICHGLRGPIHYDEPSDSAHPLSFVIDEIHPISKYRLFGYPSPEAAAQDWANLQAAHYICNAEKGAKTNYVVQQAHVNRPRNALDGNW